MSKGGAVNAARQERIHNLLGMSYGAARGKLIKQIMFDMVKQLGVDNCVRCGETIDCIEDLSIEHIQPWENQSAELFWDMDNIAFSHLSCNKGHTSGSIKRRYVGPDGTAWCSFCKQYKTVDMFCANTSRWNGLNNGCRSCVSARRKNKRETVDG